MYNSLFQLINEFEKLNYGLYKPNNNSPKCIRGNYELSIDNNVIILVDKTNNMTIKTRCHPEDNFDIGVGIREAFKKMNEQRQALEQEKPIKIGDCVKIIDSAKAYDTYPEWLYNKINFNFIKQYQYGIRPNVGEVGQVIAMGKHSKNDNVLIGIQSKNKVYIMDIKGVKKVVKM